MFTGIVGSTAEIRSITSFSEGLEISFKLEAAFLDTNIGDSIAIDGVCSTIVELSEQMFLVHYLPETLSKTTIGKWKVGDRVNLELSLQPTSRIGGHFVTGHVDTTGRVIEFTQHGKFREITIGFDSQFSHLVIPKGSIALNGISLTIVDLTHELFSCHIIPHTVENTNLSYLHSGVSFVNLEFDMMGKYLYRFKEQGAL